MRPGAVVLAGGRSTRMGTAKAALEWHGSTLLCRTVGIVGRATGGPVVVVRSAGQHLPELPPATVVVTDPRDARGPVQGIAAGLAALRDLADVAFVAATDLPFLHPAFVRRVLRPFTEPAAPDAVLPVARGYRQPLAAGYRTSLAGLAEQLVEDGRARPAFLLERCAVTRLDDEALLADAALGALDPGLDSLLNVNSPADYAAARARPAPRVTVQLAGALARPGGPWAVHAATLRIAAAAAGLAPGPHVAVLLNDGEPIDDGDVPLATGDQLLFLPAAEAPPAAGGFPEPLSP